jgi:uncharacterized protein YndB with AHSA1/START domain
MSPTQASPQIVLQLRRTFAAPRERVFRAWTDPKELALWFAPSPDFTITVPALDLRVGGTCRVEMHHKGGSVHRLSSIYREINPPKKLAFTWRWEPEGATSVETLVTVEFHDFGESTEIVLVHERFASQEEKVKHDHGWVGCFDQLGKFLR